MSENTNTAKKLTLVSLILMIFTSVFGFANMPRAFYLMGYAAIPWYVLSAILFFIPYAFMMAEYGAAYKKETGGIYSWMEKSVGPKYAFIGTFMWYASYIIWMVNVSSTLWIPLSIKALQVRILCLPRRILRIIASNMGTPTEQRYILYFLTTVESRTLTASVRI